MSGTVVSNHLGVDDSAEWEMVNGGTRSTKSVREGVSLGSSAGSFGVACCIGLVFLYFSSQPLGPIDDWGRLAYGRLTVQLRTVPQTEPLLPLAQGMPYFATDWLAQLAGLGVAMTTGVSGLKSLYALLIALTVGLMANATRLKTGSGSLGTLTVLTFFVATWQPIHEIHAQLFGVSLFVLLLTMCTRRRGTGTDWLKIPILFVVWANLHLSFVVGLFLLACFAFGGAFDVFRRTGSLRLTMASDQVRRNFLLLELAAAGVLLNPYGPRLYSHAATFALNPILRDLSEWAPISLREVGLQAVMFTAIALMVIYRWTPRRVRSWEVFTLVGLGVSLFWSRAALVWWAAVAALLFVQHLGAILNRNSRRSDARRPATKSVVWSLLTCITLAACCYFSPLGQQFLMGREIPFQKAVSAETPVAAVEFLRANPPQGLIFCDHKWGDYLQWAGPPGVEAFVNSQVHRMPLDVWQRYQQILDQRGNWEEVLDRYAINALLLNGRTHGPLIFRLKRQTEVWKLAFEQDGQVVFTRRQPL